MLAFCRAKRESRELRAESRSDKSAGKREGHVAQPDFAVSFCTVDDAAAAGRDCRVVVPGYCFGERDVLRGVYGAEVGEGVSVDGVHAAVKFLTTLVTSTEVVVSLTRLKAPRS